MTVQIHTLFDFEHSRAKITLRPENQVAVDWWMDKLHVAHFCMNADDSKQLYDTSKLMRAAAERVEQLVQGGWVFCNWGHTASLLCPITTYRLENFWSCDTNIISDLEGERPIRNMRHLQKMVAALQTHPDSPALSSGGAIPQGEPGTVEHYLHQLQLPCEVLFSDNHYAAIYRQAPLHFYRLSNKRMFSFVTIFVCKNDTWHKIAYTSCRFRDKRLRRETFTVIQLLGQIHPDNISFSNNGTKFSISHGGKTESYDCHRSNWLIALRQQLEDQINQPRLTPQIAPVTVPTDSRPVPPTVAAVLQAHQEEPPLLAHREVAKSGRNPLPDDFGRN